MKKYIALVLALLLCFVLSLPVGADGFAVPESIAVNSASVYILNMDTGLPVVDINSRERRDIASLTKMMTALLLVENVPDLDGTLITAPTAVFVPPVTGGNGSTADIRPNEVVTARALLYGMLLPSGNEAAAIVAYYLGKENLENFYAMMNARAKELGCTDTNFTNAHGLAGMEENHYSTAYDLALIAQACWQHEAIRTAAGAASYDMPLTNLHTTAQNPENPNAAYTVYNTNHMLKPTSSVYRDYIKGLKTGSTHAAGRTFTGIAANSKGETYAGVFLGAPWDPAPDGYAYSFHDAMALFDWVFANFAVQPTLDVTTPITEVPVKLSSDADVVQLLPADDLNTILPLQNSAGVLEHVFDVPESVNAPIAAGAKIGTVTLRFTQEYGGKVIGTVDLLAAQDIARNPLLNIIYAIGEFFKGTYFRVVLILTGIYIVLYFSVMLWLRTQQRKRRKRMQRCAANLGDVPIDYMRGSSGGNAPPRKAPLAPTRSRPRGTGRSTAPPGTAYHAGGGRQENRAAATAPGDTQTLPRRGDTAPPDTHTASRRGSAAQFNTHTMPLQSSNPAPAAQQTAGQAPGPAAAPATPAAQAPAQPAAKQSHAQRLKIPQRPSSGKDLRPPRTR